MNLLATIGGVIDEVRIRRSLMLRPLDAPMEGVKRMAAAPSDNP